MPAPQKILPTTPGGWAVTALGAAGAALSVWALWPVSPRTRVAEAALSQVGSSDAAKYWADVLPGYPASSYPKDWCGGFALWALHQAGLAKDYVWVIGVGFLDRLHTTQNPDVGDVAYFDTNQHHAVIVGIDRAAGTMDLVNGNGTGGKVSTSTAPLSHAAGFYSIGTLLGSGESDSSAPWIVASAVVLGAGAWVLLPAPRRGSKDDAR